MSRIGKKPVPLAKGVTATINGNDVSLKGPKGEASLTLNEGISVAQEGDTLQVTRVDDSRQQRAYHGLNRSLLSNMAIGVSEGYTRALDIIGVGFKAEVQGDSVFLTVGFTNPKEYKLPQGVSATVEKNTRVVLTSVDKQKVGMAASEIRSIRPPEPYKGKGIKYAEEQIKRKVGKTSA